MSVSPSTLPGAPSLAEVLLRRTFARPPEPFVDGDLMKAFGHVDDRVAISTNSGDSHEPPPQDPRDRSEARVDVRI